MTWEVETMIYGGRGLCTCLCHSMYCWEGAVAVRQWPWISIPLYHNVSNQNTRAPLFVFVFSPRPTIYALGTAPPWGLEKEGARNPVRKSFVFASRTLSFCTRGIAANAHRLYSDHRGACDEKKMSGLKIKRALGFQLHVTFISD